MQTGEERPTDKLLNHFSDWLRLRVAVAWILKLKDKLKLKIKNGKFPTGDPYAAGRSIQCGKKPAASNVG